MEREEFLAAKQLIDEAYKAQLDKLYVQYVKGLAKHRVGEKITSTTNQTIIIDKILYAAPNTFGNSKPLPALRYFGRALTQKGEPYKDGTKLTISPEQLGE